MTVIWSACPDCASTLGFWLTMRGDPATGLCVSCGYEFVLRPDGIARGPRVRCAAGV